MAGQRQPIAVVKGRGAKHLTKAEIAQREASEVNITAPTSGEGSKIRAPYWLPSELREDFNELRTQLVEAGIFSKLDKDVLGMYLVARRQWVAAFHLVQDALDADDMETAAAWASIQDKAFKQVRGCAGDMGLSVSSRCKLILPQKAEGAQADNPLLKLLERKEARAANG